jgi:hypothetical protein
MRVTLWDDGVEVCNVRQDLDRFSNNGEKEYTFDCGSGRSAIMGDNGRDLTYNTPDGSIKLSAYDWTKDLKSDVCGTVVKGSEFENVFDNGKCGNCPVQKLCNSDRCIKFDGKCK